MIKPIWDSAWLTNMGDFHKQLEKELKEYMGIRNMVLFVNGHMALEMAIQALGADGRGDYHSLQLCVHHPCDCAQ